MIPVVTPDEMRAIDAGATVPVDALVERAGAAVARVAIERLGGTYGRRVVVVAGKGNNGADGRAAARRLSRRGARVLVIDAAAAPDRVPDCDLCIDAAYGTGFHGDYVAPDPAGATVLAVDVPTGVDALTGEAGDAAVRADATVTFAALKPGLLLTDRAGVVAVEDIGLDVSSARMHLVEPADVLKGLPARGRDGHKYDRGVLIVAGSPGMGGSARLAARAALRGGAGYCRLGSPGTSGASLALSDPVEAVAVALDETDWAAAALAATERMRAAAVGPGLGRAEGAQASVREFVAACPVPLVIDADALFALGDVAAARTLLASRTAPAVLTPHDGEFARLAGTAPGPDRLAAARSLAAELGVAVLLKGAVTVVAEPAGRALFCHAGPASLATAGTGDVLTGVITAFLAAGLASLEASAYAAVAHGAAAQQGRRVGLVAGDLPDLLAAFLSGR